MVSDKEVYRPGLYSKQQIKDTMAMHPSVKEDFALAKATKEYHTAAEWKRIREAQKKEAEEVQEEE